MTRTRTLSLLIVLCLLVLTIAPVLAQDDPVMEEKYKNGFLPTGTYAGPFTKVNLHNGNFIINLPLFSACPDEPDTTCRWDFPTTASSWSENGTSEPNSGWAAGSTKDPPPDAGS